MPARITNKQRSLNNYMCNTYMYTEECSQQTFDMLNNYLAGRFDKVYQKHDCETIKYYMPYRKSKVSHNL